VHPIAGTQNAAEPLSDTASDAAADASTQAVDR
jgi:hypothetical protein